MKKTISLISMVLFSCSLFAQQRQTDLYKLESAKRQIKTGTIITLSGIGTTALGTVMLITGTNQKPKPVPGVITRDGYTSVGGFIGYGLMFVGPVLVIIGLPDILFGSIKKDKAMSNLKMTLVTFKTNDNTAPIPGIGFCYRF